MGNESESLIKVRGTIELGTFDPIAERDRAIGELNNLRDQLEAARRYHAEEGQELRDQLHRKELEVIRLSLQMQIDVLDQTIKAGIQKVTFLEQYAQFRKMAEVLGFYPAEKGGKNV